jgi:hypothetical protein
VARIVFEHVTRRYADGVEAVNDMNLATADGHMFKAKIDVLEKLGAHYYAHFTVDSERVSSSELEELSEGVDAARVAPSAEGVQVVARLGSASGVKQGQEAGLWLDTSQLHLFDQETGRSLLTSENSRRKAPSPRQPPAAA